MSGAEAMAVLGTIAAAIAIIQASERVYDAARNASGLHEAFRKVAENMPIVLDTLQHAEQVFQPPDDGAQRDALEQAAKAAEPIMTTCEDNVRQLRDIFERVVPGGEAGRRERYLKALQSAMPGKKRKVEELMKEILEKLQLLHTNQFFKDSTRSGQLSQALEELAQVPSSLPEPDGRYHHSGSGSMNVNPGSGTQYIYSQSGESNRQFNAHTQHFGSVER